MTAIARPRAASGPFGQALAVLAVASAWAIHLPLGSKYLVYLLCAVLAMSWLVKSGQVRAALRWPALAWPLALWLVLVLSASWSTAPPDAQWSHAWHYGRWLFMPLIALACPAEAARRGLRHFAVASTAVGVLMIADHLHHLPASALWSTTLGAMGNQRIAVSLLLALSAALALTLALDARHGRRQRLAWLLAAATTALAVTLQDRRTGMVALPVLLAALALSRQGIAAGASHDNTVDEDAPQDTPSLSSTPPPGSPTTTPPSRRRAWPRSAAALAGVALLAGLTWQQSDTVRARFAEGLAELQTYAPTGVVATSWGMRLRMIEVTLEMVRDKPVLGHGLGSWLSQWQRRARGGGSLLEEQLTPHNEYLLITEQAGVVGLALWLAVLATALASAWRAGRAGDAALLVWTAIAWSALFNVVVRDAKFALPLLMLAALAVAAGRDAQAEAKPPHAAA